jgi:hypothetical protein
MQLTDTIVHAGFALTSLPLSVAAAIALALLTLAGARLRIVRARRRVDAPLTEAQARAHASPLTKSILSVGPRPHRGDPEP